MEEWRDIPGAEGRYRVSNYGRIQSLIKRKGNTISPTQDPRILKQVKTALGYCFAGIAVSKGGKFKRTAVHRLVLLAFVGPCPKGLVCCHNDGNPSNNRLENLRWDTLSSNVQDSARHGTMCRGEDVITAKITEKQVRHIRDSYKGTLKEKRKVRETLSRLYGISENHLWCIATRRFWKHVP